MNMNNNIIKLSIVVSIILITNLCLSAAEIPCLKSSSAFVRRAVEILESKFGKKSNFCIVRQIDLENKITIVFSKDVEVFGTNNHTGIEQPIRFEVTFDKSSNKLIRATFAK